METKKINENEIIQNLDTSFEGFEYASMHHQLGGHGIENKSFSLNNY